MKIIDEDAATFIARFGQQSILADIDIIVHSSELYLLFGSLYLLTKLVFENNYLVTYNRRAEMK